MPTVEHQLDRDLEIYRAWTAGQRQRAIAAERGISPSAVTQACDRVRAILPPLDRSEYFHQSMEMLDNLLAVYYPLAEQGDKGAGRLVDRFLGRRGKFLGLETPQRVELAAAVAEVRDLPAEPLQVVIERILARQGRLPAHQGDGHATG